MIDLDAVARLKVGHLDARPGHTQRESVGAVGVVPDRGCLAEQGVAESGPGAPGVPFLLRRLGHVCQTGEVPPPWFAEGFAIRAI